MQATGIFVVNKKEIEYAERMELKEIPSPECSDYELHFALTRVESCYVNMDKHIVIHMESGQFYVVKFSADLWSKLKEYTQ